jgi:hypothetical protein
MVILFNLWAIPVGILIYIILLGLEHLLPITMTEPHRGWTLGIVSTLVGAGCDLLGIKGRVFFLPIWLIGLGIICYHLGWPGTVAFIGLLVIGGIGLFKGAKKKEISDWAKAQEEAVRAGMPPASNDEVQFWEWVKRILFLPIWLDYTPDLCQHNIKVLRAIQESGPSVTPEEKAKLQAFEQLLVAAQTASKPPGSELKIQGPVGDLVDAKLREAKRKVRRQRLSTPQALPATR